MLTDFEMSIEIIKMIQTSFWVHVTWKKKKWDNSKNYLLSKHKNLLSSLFMKFEKKYEKRKFWMLIINWKKNSTVISIDKKIKIEF